MLHKIDVVGGAATSTGAGAGTRDASRHGGDTTDSSGKHAGADDVVVGCAGHGDKAGNGRSTLP